MGEIVSVFPAAHLRRQRCLTGAWTMTVSLFRSVTHAIDLAAHPLVGAPKVVRPALGKSYESLFNDSRPGNFLLDLGAKNDAVAELSQPRLQRAIGVIYRPETERLSHYYHARLPQQFDVVLHYNNTRAVQPLERTALWDRGELPETYPTAL